MSIHPEYVGACRGQRVSDRSGNGATVAVSSLTGMLRTEFGASGKATNNLNY